MDTVEHFLAVVFIRVGQENREFVAADTGGLQRFVDSLGQHFTGTLKQRIADGMALFVVDVFQVVQIDNDGRDGEWAFRSEEHTSELQSLMRISYAVFCLKKKKHYNKFQQSF